MLALDSSYLLKTSQSNFLFKISNLLKQRKFYLTLRKNNDIFLELFYFGNNWECIQNLTYAKSDYQI